MAVNSDYKITSLDGTELFNFNNTSTGVGTNWEPSNVNTSTSAYGGSVDMPYNDLTVHYNTGLRGRNVVVQGELLKDGAKQNQHRLSFCVADKEPKKLWVGEDWFSYVIGQETTFIRAEEMYILNRYRVSFNAPYPIEYCANSSDGVTPVPSTVSFSGSPLTASLDSTAELGTTGNYNYYHILPNFFITGGTLTNVSKIVFKDPEGRTLTFEPDTAVTNGIGYVIMPYGFRDTPEGFNPQAPIAYQMASTASPTTTDWLQDLDVYDSTYFTQSSNEPVRVFPTIEMDKSVSGYRGMFNDSYPRFSAFTSAGNTITATVTGTATDLAVTAQYLYVRVP